MNTKHAAERKAEQASGLYDAAADQVTDLIDSVKEKGQEWVEGAKGRGQDLIDDVQGRGQDAWKDLKTWVRKNPGPAVGASLVAGAVLYALLSRRQD